MNFERIREMSRSSSKIVGQACANLLDKRRKIDKNWASAESLNEVVLAVIGHGSGTDMGLRPSYSEEERCTANPFNAYIENVLDIVRRSMDGISVDSKVFTRLHDSFNNHFRPAEVFPRRDI
jgi:hypothetical protein